MNIYGFQKTSLLDYPGKISSIIFTRGCNFRCPYCHNPELVCTTPQDRSIAEDEILVFLKSRKDILDGVVVTGGEPCLQSDLADFIRNLKYETGLLVKLDTNGTFPDALELLIGENLLDYIAMDIKAPLEKYSYVTNSEADVLNISKSINIIMGSKVDYEFRTTVLRSLLTPDDLNNIGLAISGAKRYYLQKFVNSKILNPDMINPAPAEENYSDDEFSKILDMLRLHINIVDVR